MRREMMAMEERVQDELEKDPAAALEEFSKRREELASGKIQPYEGHGEEEEEDILECYRENIALAMDAFHNGSGGKDKYKPLRAALTEKEVEEVVPMLDDENAGQPVVRFPFRPYRDTDGLLMMTTCTFSPTAVFRHSTTRRNGKLGWKRVTNKAVAGR